MKKQLIVMLAFVTFGMMSFNRTPTATVNDEPVAVVNFEKGTWQNTLDKAKKEDKLIFLEVYAEWCGYCKKLKRTTLVDAGVVNLLNSNYLNVEVDGEKGEGIEIAKKYNVKSYPALLLIDGDGKVVKAEFGYLNPKSFQNFAAVTQK